MYRDILLPHVPVGPAGPLSAGHAVLTAIVTGTSRWEDAMLRLLREWLHSVQATEWSFRIISPRKVAKISCRVLLLTRRLRCTMRVFIRRTISA
jgi:hypothetical protein